MSLTTARLNSAQDKMPLKLTWLPSLVLQITLIDMLMAHDNAARYLAHLYISSIRLNVRPSQSCTISLHYVALHTHQDRYTKGKLSTIFNLHVHVTHGLSNISWTISRVEECTWRHHAVHEYQCNPCMHELRWYKIIQQPEARKAAFINWHHKMLASLLNADIACDAKQ